MYTLHNTKDKKIAIVDLKDEPNKVFSVLVWNTIEKYSRLWKKIQIFVNKKWYSTWKICNDCWNVPKCKNCDIPIAHYLVLKNQIWMCSICKTIYDDTNICSTCKWTNVNNFWLWIQKVQELIKNNFWFSSVLIDNTHVNSENKINKTMEILSQKSTTIVLSTHILSYPAYKWKPDIVIFLNADIWLNIPDFSSTEKIFFSIYEIIAKYPTKNYIIQTLNSELYLYQSLAKLNIDWFWEKELENRKAFGYPPFWELAVLIYKSEIEQRVYSQVDKVYKDLTYLIDKENLPIKLYSTPPLVFKTFGKYHYNIVIKWVNLKQFLDNAVNILKIQSKWFQIDRLPNSII